MSVPQPRAPAASTDEESQDPRTSSILNCTVPQPRSPSAVRGGLAQGLCTDFQYLHQGKPGPCVSGNEGRGKSRGKAKGFVA